MHRQPHPLPSNAQLLCLVLLIGGSLALAFVGPDYIAPSFEVWQIRRDASLAESQRRNFIPNTGPYLPLQPQYTIDKAWWTSSARTGQIAFALFPLCVLFALKAPPFAIFAIPFMIQIFFDKLAWLHRWSGRLIWFLTSIHVALWSVQLTRDRKPSTGRVAYVYAFSYMPFIFGWIAFALLTFIIIMSAHPIRRKFYEAFYFLHVLLVPLMLISAAFHHPALWWWCWAALAIWAGERIWRGIWWLVTNCSGFGNRSSPVMPKSSHPTTLHSDIWEMDHLHSQALPTHIDSQTIRSPSPLNPHYHSHRQSLSSHYSPPIRSPSVRSLLSPEADHTTHSLFSVPPYIPPQGYVHAELLSGHTVRLRLITPGFLPWAPGQHFLIKVPSVSKFTTHPFTCASVFDYESPTDEGRLVVMLIRARNGWTQDLWNLVARMIAKQSSGDVPTPEHLPKRGVLLRGYVDGPFGSSIRARWGSYSTVLIIAGGSGVSFGLSVLQYICMCLSGRDGKSLGGRPGGWGKKSFQTQRVRFVWLIREYAHIQWCASIVRRCLSLVPSSALQIDIFVTKFKPVAAKESLESPMLRIPERPHFAPDPISFKDLQPPHPSFAHGGLLSPHSDSSDTLESQYSDQSDVDLTYYTGEFQEPVSPKDLDLVHESHMLELTNFDGDNDTGLPGEKVLSKRVKKEGKLRRARLQKVASTFTTKKELQERTVRILDSGGLGGTVDRSSAVSPISRHSMDKPFSTSTNSGHKRTKLSVDTTYVSQTSPYSNMSTRLQQSIFPEMSFPPRSPTTGRKVATSSLYSSSSWDVGSEAGSSRGLLSAPDGSFDAIQFGVSEEEAQDINIVAEYARPGKPKLDRILADEVEQSGGPIVVACCGPTSLNAIVRKIIAAQIDPARVWRGDKRGSISLVSEEFEY